jgi:hypothetical protein
MSDCAKNSTPDGRTFSPRPRKTQLPSADDFNCDRNLTNFPLQPCLTSLSGTLALAPTEKVPELGTSPLYRDNLSASANKYPTAVSAPTKPVSSANMVSTSAVNASERKLPTLDSLRYDPTGSTPQFWSNPLQHR